jgi:hypothetical protein
MNEKTVRELAGKLRGELITPADPSYEAARKVYNGMIDRRPALIARAVEETSIGGPPSWPRRPPAAIGRDQVCQVALPREGLDALSVQLTKERVEVVDLESAHRRHSSSTGRHRPRPT